MARDQLLRNPRIARLILVIGAVIYFFLCWPLYGRRGFPEVNPFWLAMIWLWIPPVLLSAIYDKWCRKRAYDLIIYALVAGFVVSWGTVSVRPSNKTIVRALIELITYGPVMIVCIAMVEVLSRVILIGIRRFPLQKQCENCGYCLRGLTKPRCPECGTPFPAELLDPDYRPIMTPLFRRWSTLLMALILIATVAFPFTYRVRAYHECKVDGMHQAEVDWVRGNAKWYVTRDEIYAMTPHQIARFDELTFKQDPSTGVEIRYMTSHDPQLRTWQSSYRSVIERKLREASLAPPNFEQGTSTSPSTATTDTNPSNAVE